MRPLPSFNRRFVLKSRPVDLPERDNFEIEEIPHPALGADEVRVRVEYVALSPWQGQRLKDFRNYTKPFEIGELIDCDILGEIIEIGAGAYDTSRIGQLVTARLGWQEYAVAKPHEMVAVSERIRPDALADGAEFTRSDGILCHGPFWPPYARSDNGCHVCRRLRWQLCRTIGQARRHARCRRGRRSGKVPACR